MNNKIKNVYFKLFPNFILELKQLVNEADSILDVGCGSNSPIRYLKPRSYCVGVDGFKPSLDKSKKQKIHNKYVYVNLLKIDKKFKKKSFDCVLALDVIEHFTKAQGNELLKKMEAIAKKKVIIFTPNGFVPQGNYENNDFQVHKSGWNVTEMQKKGYRVLGVHGYKKLRGDMAELKYAPKFFWRLISDMTQLLVRRNPKHAFALLCVKELGQKKI